MNDYDELIINVRKGDIQRINELLDSGLDVNYTIDKSENTRIFTYVLDADNPLELFKFLLNKGADPSLLVVNAKGYSYEKHLDAICFVFRYDRLFSEIYASNEPKVLEIHKLAIWLKEKDNQIMLIEKFPILYKTYKSWGFLHAETVEKFNYLESAEQLNII